MTATGQPGDGWAERLGKHPLIVVLGLLATLATIGGFIVQLRQSATGVTSIAEGAPTSHPAPSAGPEPRDDQTIANAVVLQAEDLGPGWTENTGRTRDDSIASFAAVPECASSLDVIAGEGETAIAGWDRSFSNGNTAVSSIVAFYDAERRAIESGPFLLRDPEYQSCIRAKVEQSIIDTNGPVDDFSIQSATLPSPEYGDRVEAIQHLASFVVPGLGPRSIVFDEWVVQRGRAVALLQWSSDSIDATATRLELQVWETLARRLVGELSLDS